jgi:glutamine amidotransferase-like uncharacterized protein
MSKSLAFTLKLTLNCLLIFTIFAHAAYAEKARIAIFIDRGERPHTKLRTNLDSERDMQTTLVYEHDIRRDSLKNFDVVVMPGGSGRLQAESLEPAGQSEVRRFINDGGIYMGICAGAYLASATRSQYLGLLPLKTADSRYWHRGKARLRIEFTPFGMEVFGVRDRLSVVNYHNGPVFPKFRDLEIPGVRILCYFREEIVKPGGQIGVMKDAPAMVLGNYGKGMFLVISPHPEGTPGLEQIEGNAIRWMVAHRSRGISN